MKRILKKYFIVCVSLYTLAQLIPAISISGNWNDFFYASFIMSILLYIVKPIARLVFFPVNLVTLNLFSWVINMGVIYIWNILTPNVNITSWQYKGGNYGPVNLGDLTFSGWQVVLLASIFLTILMQFFAWLTK